MGSYPWLSFGWAWLYLDLSVTAWKSLYRIYGWGSWDIVDLSLDLLLKMTLKMVVCLPLPPPVIHASSIFSRGIGSPIVKEKFISLHLKVPWAVSLLLHVLCGSQGNYCSPLMHPLIDGCLHFLPRGTQQSFCLYKFPEAPKTPSCTFIDISKL